MMRTVAPHRGGRPACPIGGQIRNTLNDVGLGNAIDHTWLCRVGRFLTASLLQTCVLATATRASKDGCSRLHDAKIVIVEAPSVFLITMLNTLPAVRETP